MLHLIAFANLQQSPMAPEGEVVASITTDKKHLGPHLTAEKRLTYIAKLLGLTEFELFEGDDPNNRPNTQLKLFGDRHGRVHKTTNGVNR